MRKVLVVLGLLLSGIGFGYNLTVDINGPIRAETKNKVLALILKAGDTSKTIRLNINTPGGQSDVMEDMYNAILHLRQKGHKVYCVIEEAYSAGFAIAAACSKRFAYKDSTFMWHYGWISFMGTLNAMEAKELSDELEKNQKYLDSLVRKYFIVSDEAFYYLRNNELILTAEEMNIISPGYVTIIERKEENK